MSDDPPPSLLITPDRRRRLTQLFAEARQLANEPRPRIRQIHERLAECVRCDPGNILYLDALLANLRQRPSASVVQRFLAGILSRLVGEAAPQSAVPLPGRFTAAARLLQAAPEQLWLAPQSVPLLRSLAQAAGECEFEEVELRLLNEARRLAPDDAETLREVARALTRQGQFEEAVGPWHAVAALVPGDQEAREASEDLAPAVRGITAVEQGLDEAQAAGGADLALIAARQQLRLAQSEQRIAIARRRAEHDPHSRANTLVERFQGDHQRLEIEILALQAEQHPTDAAVRLELARCLKRAANYSAAATVLEDSLKLSPDQTAALVELGECRQHLRQFDEALGCYLKAATLGESSAPGEIPLLALYRAGVLAAALGRTDLARTQFETIHRLRPDYRDVRQRLG